jgi:hypothetical protein
VADRDDSIIISRRQALLAGAAAGAVILAPRFARAASVPHNYDCDKASAFVMDPNQHRRVGYLTELEGFGRAPLAKDLVVNVPWLTATPAYTRVASALVAGPAQPKTLKVVGVIEKIAWNGGVGDPFSFTAYLSQQNASQIKTAQQATLTTTTIKSLGFWVANYDQETKVWFEQFYPLNPPTLSGIIGPKDNPKLNVDLTPVPVKDGIDVMVYKVSFEIVPAANRAFTLSTANSPKTRAAKAWGLVVGTPSPAAPK